MPGWKFVIGGGEKIKNQAPQNSGNTSRAESANSGGNGGMQNNGGMQSNENRSMTNAVAYQPQQGGYANTGNNNGGGQMMAYSNMMAGDYASQNNGGQGYGMFMPGHALQNRQMGYLAPLPEWEDRSGRGGGGTRNEEYEPESGDVEARRRRSRRTGRFIRGAGENGPEMHHRDYDDDDDGRERRGSYSKHEREEEGGGEVQRLHKKIKKLEQRLEESEEAAEHLRHLKKEVKRLKQALEEMKGEKEEKGGEERQKKKKKGKPEDDDDDDDDDPVAGLKKLLKEGVEGKDFLKHLPHIFQAAFAVIAEPPSTWPSYLEKGDYSGIYVMEAKELMKAIEQYKAGQKGMQDVLKEMKHTGAALIQMYAHLLQQMEEKK